MKLALSLILILALIFSGCEKDDNNNSSGTPPPSNPPSTFTATVNGNNVNGNNFIAVMQVDNSTPMAFRYFFVAAVCDTQVINASFNDTINSVIPTIGSYNNPPWSVSSLDYNSMSDTINEYISSNAQFTITSVNAAEQKVSGTFSGTVVGDSTGNTIVITNGVFSNIYYEIQ